MFVFNTLRRTRRDCREYRRWVAQHPRLAEAASRTRELDRGVDGCEEPSRSCDQDRRCNAPAVSRDPHAFWPPRTNWPFNYRGGRAHLCVTVFTIRPTCAPQSDQARRSRRSHSETLGSNAQKIVFFCRGRPCNKAGGT
jgi:hypothetical protein